MLFYYILFHSIFKLCLYTYISFVFSYFYCCSCILYILFLSLRLLLPVIDYYSLYTYTYRLLFPLYYFRCVFVCVLRTSFLIPIYILVSYFYYYLFAYTHYICVSSLLHLRISFTTTIANIYICIYMYICTYIRS